MGRREARQSAAASRPPPVAEEDDLEFEVRARALHDLGADALGEDADVGRGALLVVDDEVGVLLGDDRAPDPEPLETQAIDDRAGGRTIRWIAEDAAGGGQPERLVGLAPATNVVEPFLDDVGRLRGELEGRAEDEVDGSTRGGCVLTAPPRRPRRRASA